MRDRLVEYNFIQDQLMDKANGLVQAQSTEYSVAFLMEDNTLQAHYWSMDQESLNLSDNHSPWTEVKLRFRFVPDDGESFE